VRAAHRDAHAVTALCKRAYDLFSDEAGTAEHNDENTNNHETLQHPSFRADAQWLRTEARNFVEMCRYECFDTDWQQAGNQRGAKAWLMFLRNDADAADLN
jgi:hypothetical protein